MASFQFPCDRHLVHWVTILLSAGTLTACGGGSERAQTCADGAGICANPVNRILVPRLETAGFQSREADPLELCRRMTVDLIGRIPTVTELDQCSGESPVQMVDRLQAMPEYRTNQQRVWARRLGYDTTYTVWWQIDDLDRQVGQMIDGDLAYSEFARRALWHPGFFVPAVAQGGYETVVFETFMGRPARADEIAGLRPLVAASLATRQVCDGRASEVLYRECLREQEEGERDPDQEPCARLCLGEPLEGMVNSCGCPVFEDPEEFGQPVFGCRGTAFGVDVDYGVSECDEDDFQGGSIYLALTSRTAGDRNVCEDLGAQCLDLELIYEDGEEHFASARPLEPASDAVLGRLLTLGDALVSRDDFWEAAVDRELRSMLGWWQTSFRQPETDLPAVRSVLANTLRSGGSLRELHRLIVTSLLYTMPSEGLTAEGCRGADECAPAPEWAAGPSKFLGGERWLDSAQTAVDDTLWGVCDGRFASGDTWLGYEKSILVGEVEEREPTLELDDAYEALEDDEEALDGFEEFFYGRAAYHVLAAEMGGCLPAPAPTAANLAVVSAQSRAATVLCAYGRGASPDPAPADTSTASLQVIADHQARAFLSARAGGADATMLRQDMAACVAAGVCPTADVAARWSCARVLDSTAFAIY